jgi:hypothetical protein
VGIGTTTPAYLLSLASSGLDIFNVDSNGYVGKGSGGFTPILKIDDTNAVFHTSLRGFSSQNHVSLGYYGLGNGVGPGISVSSQGGFAWSNSTTNSYTTRDLWLKRDSASTLRVSSDGTSGVANLMVNGNVGIATSTAAAQLVMQATTSAQTVWLARFATSTGLTTTGIDNKGNLRTSIVKAIGYNTNMNRTDSLFEFHDSSGNTIMDFRNPDFQLRVFGTSAMSGLTYFYSGAAFYGGGVSNADSATSPIIVPSRDQMRLWLRDTTNKGFMIEGTSGQTQDFFRTFTSSGVTNTSIAANGSTTVASLTVADVNLLGSDKVTNGSFTGNDTGWATTTGWAYVSNRMNKGSDGTGTLSQNVSVVAGETYLVTYLIQDWSVGSVTITLGGVSVPLSTPTTVLPVLYSHTITAISTGNLIFTPTNTSRFYIDNIAVKKVSGGALATLGTTTLATTAGNVGIGTSSPYAKLSVAGQVVADYFTATSTATSTFAGGIDAARVCLTGTTTCLSASGGSTASTTLLADSNTFSGSNAFTNTLTTKDINLDGVAGNTISQSVTGQALTLTTAGASGAGTVGNMTLTAGTHAGSFPRTHGNVYITAPGNTGQTVKGGSVYITAGDTGAGSSAGHAGSISLTAGYGTAGTVGNGTITFNGNNATEFGRFDILGNFGLGTSSPYAKLSVVGTVVATNFHATSTTATSTFAGEVALLKPVKLASYTVGTLPTCNTNSQGYVAYVTDALAPTFLVAITGGGAVIVPVFCDGTNWVAD